MSTRLRNRIRKAKRILNQRKSAALLLSSSTQKTSSRDSSFTYRPNSNLFYLTECAAKDIALLITTESSKPFLFVPPTNDLMITWEGAPPNYKAVSKLIDAELIVTNNIQSEIWNRLNNIELLFHENEPGSISHLIASKILETPHHSRAKKPHSLTHADLLMENLRLFKDKHEIEAIKKAAKITNETLFQTLPFICAGAIEKDLAYTIEYLFKMHGGGIAFDTIVATGKSAATLHYEYGKNKLKNGELLLIDCGATFDMYSADITRVIPVNGKFSELQADMYEIVLDAQHAAINTIKAGVPIRKVYDAAARVITEGLVYLKVLKGSVSSLMSKKAYRPYFMHGIGHSLGLDVHDIGALRSDEGVKLEKDMVLTIEPGLYFSKPTKKIPASGIRIEDDLLVTPKGSTVLSAGFPKEIDEIEQILQ